MRDNVSMERPDAPAARVPTGQAVRFRATGFAPAPRGLTSWLTFALVLALWQAAGSLGLVSALFLPAPLGIVRAPHIRQQAEMAAMLSRRYAGDRAVTYVNLGDTIDLADEQLSGDRMHPTREGNRRIATELTESVLTMAAVHPHDRR